MVGQRRAIRTALEARFGELPAEVSARLEEITDTERLAGLVRHATVATSLEAFVQDLERTRP